MNVFWVLWPISDKWIGNRPHVAQPAPNKGFYSQVGFSYDGDGQEDLQYSDGEEDDDEDEDEEEDFNSDDCNDEAMDSIAKEFGVKRYGWLVYMDKKAKEEARRQKEVIKGDPSIVSLSDFCIKISEFLGRRIQHPVLWCMTEEVESQGEEESLSDGKRKGKRSCSCYRN